MKIRPGRLVIIGAAIVAKNALAGRGGRGTALLRGPKDLNASINWN